MFIFFPSSKGTVTSISIDRRIINAAECIWGDNLSGFDGVYGLCLTKKRNVPNDNHVYGLILLCYCDRD